MPENEQPQQVNETNKIIEEKVRAFMKDIYPFVDSVHVFTTKHENNKIGTFAYQEGQGNWYARYGQISEWVYRNDETKPIDE